MNQQRTGNSNGDKEDRRRILDFDSIRSPGMETFLDHWESRKRGRIAPLVSDFHLIDIPPQLIPYVLLVDVIDDPQDFIYRFWGTEHTMKKGFDKTGKSVLDFPFYRHGLTRSEYVEVVKTKKPVFARGLIVLDDIYNKPPFEMSVMRCPLIDENNRITRIVSYSEWAIR